MEVTKNSLIGDVLDYNVDIAQFFMETHALFGLPTFPR